MIHRFDGVSAAAEFRNIREVNVKSLRHFSRGELVIRSPHRNRAAQEKRVLKSRGLSFGFFFTMKPQLLQDDFDVLVFS